MAKILNRPSPFGDRDDRITLLDAQWDVVRPIVRRAMLDNGTEPDQMDNAAFEAYVVELCISAGWDTLREIGAKQSENAAAERVANVRQRRDRAREARLATIDRVRQLTAEPPPPAPDPA